MKAQLLFGHCRCGEPPTSPDAAEQPWANLAGLGDCASWVEGSAAAPTPPRVGVVGRLSLRYPFSQSVAEPFWTLYCPPNAAYNGFSEAPEQMAEALVAKARIRRLLDVEARTAFAEVDTLAVMTMTDLLALPEGAGRCDFAPLPDRQIASAGDYRFVSASLEGDAGSWAVGRRIDGVDHLLLRGDWDYHRDVFYAGHRVLTTRESPFGGMAGTG